MAVKNALFLFEVVVESVKIFVESRLMVIKSDFANIFSLELKDPKQMHIVMPEPLPLPPEPVGKKGKKKPKPKKKGKKGKQTEPPPPPEPAIQSGQSVLFTSNAEFLVQNMKEYPMEVSLWSKEDNMIFIGASSVPWDPVFISYLERVYNCEEPPPPTVKDEYNVFEEGTAKLMARLGIQVKLTYLTERVTCSFRTLSEDPTVKKFLYTGMNSKTTSFMCNYKTTDEDFASNCNKIENQYTKDRKVLDPKVVYANYKNAPSAKLSVFVDADYCCVTQPEKPPDSKYKAPETCPDIDFIADYVRKIITSCNDNLRMLTPRPTIKPRIKATDIDKLCYCRQTAWPEGALAERFKQETQSGPCPRCTIPEKAVGGTVGKKTFDIANIRGPCGRHDCKIARELRAYIEQLFEEDDVEFNLNDMIGPCGSKECTLATRIQQFLRHEGPFAQGATKEGLSTQCACIEQMQAALTKQDSCESICSKDCEIIDSSDEKTCEGKGCPYTSVPTSQLYHVYYFTVEYDNIDSPPKSNPNSEAVSAAASTATSAATSAAVTAANSAAVSAKGSAKLLKFKHCPADCPGRESSESIICSKSMCSTSTKFTKLSAKEIPIDKCSDLICPNKNDPHLSPPDSDIVINFDDIYNPCCVKSCEMADKVKTFISEGELAKRTKKPYLEEKDPCYCDCSCTFKFSNKTTYCAVCGGYECLGEDVKRQPEYMKPHPCPVYHKLYDKFALKTVSPWPEEEAQKERDYQKLQASVQENTGSGKVIKTTVSKGGTVAATMDKKTEKKSPDEKSITPNTKPKKATRAAPEADEKSLGLPKDTSPDKKKDVKAVRSYMIVPVPKHMGWLWTAEDIPGLKFRPKWRPGAAHKLLVRRYRTVREGVDTIAKKKRAMMNRKKKIEMKPTLVVKKVDGEYTVQMEVFKKYSKERLPFQYPYDEKVPLVYSIGKTEEERIKLQKQRERRERRETRRKCRLLQSTFRDKCQEICLKAYNQSLGLKPLASVNAPECPCELEELKPPSPPIDSCSCSETCSVSTSDTDGDEWIIEFTPPMARWDPKAKHPPSLVDNECQYSYLDYKVKLLDKLGNPIPRYFTGPDGKQQCSDLGGFWGQGHQWMEINKDGYIGPDGRWVPLNFTGPDGMFYLSEDGFFADSSGQVWRIGIDGYVDKDGKWAWYHPHGKKEKGTKSMSTLTGTTDTKRTAGSKYDSTKAKTTNLGKGKQDSKTKHDSINKATGPKVGDKRGVATAGGKAADKNKEKKTMFNSKVSRSPIVMNVSVNYEGKRKTRGGRLERMRPTEAKKIAKYSDIMQDLQTYDELGELKAPVMTNRACNTRMPRKKISPFTMEGNCGQKIRVVPDEFSCSMINSSGCQSPTVPEC